MNVQLGRVMDRYLGVPLCWLLGCLSRLWPGPKRVFNRDPQKILVIKLFGLGNIVELMPALDLLKKHYPKAKITMLTLESNAGVLEGFSPVEDIIYFRDKGWGQALLCALKLIPSLYVRRFELVLDMDPIGRFCTLLSWATGAPKRLGFGTRGQYREQLYTEVVPLREGQHIRRIFLDLLVPLGIQHFHLPSLLAPYVGSRATAKVKKLLGELGVGKEIILINPNASSVAFERRWPLENFRDLIQLLLADPAQEREVILVGSPSERPHVMELMALLNHKDRVRSLAGETSLEELGALIDHSQLFISNDSGPLHLASAFGVPTIGLFGPESPDRYGPVGPGQHILYSGRSCSPCMSFSNEKRVRCTIGAACLTDISPSEAAALSLRILGQSVHQVPACE